MNHPFHESGAPSVFWWILITGGIGFAAGFFGPIALNPEANQGPLVGIFISGPVGAFLGLVLYLLSRPLHFSAARQWQVLWGRNSRRGNTFILFAGTRLPRIPSRCPNSRMQAAGTSSG